MQESLVRAWRNVGSLDDRGFVRAWLYKIATNRCLTALEGRGRRELPADLAPGRPATEISWLEPLPQWYRGPDEIREFLLRGPLQSRWRFLPTTANGQVAFGTYRWDDAAGRYVPGGLDVLTIRGGHVADVTAFLAADLTLFQLPAHLGR